MKTFILSVLGSAIIASTCFGGYATAAPLLDQVVTSAKPFSDLPVASALRYRDEAQTFTVGITGLLTSIEIPILRSPFLQTDVVFDVRKTTTGKPSESNSDVLVSKTISAASLRDDLPRVFVSIDDLNIHVDAGEVLAAVLRVPFETGDQEVSWTTIIEANYRGGSWFIRERFSDPNAKWTILSPEFDLSIRTFVDPVGVLPEPGTLALFTALPLLLVAKRAKRRAAGDDASHIGER